MISCQAIVIWYDTSNLKIPSAMGHGPTSAKYIPGPLPFNLVSRPWLEPVLVLVCSAFTGVILYFLPYLRKQTMALNALVPLLQWFENSTKVSLKVGIFVELYRVTQDSRFEVVTWIST